MEAPVDLQVIAREAAEGAGPFLHVLVGRYGQVVDGLRSGRDQQALHTLAALVDELEHFVRFLVLIQDQVALVDTGTSKALNTYRHKLLRIIESIEPALADVDLVEVADALEDDLLPALHAYANIDGAVRAAVAH